MTLGEMVKTAKIDLCVEIRDEKNMDYISAAKLDSRALEPYHGNEVVAWLPGRSHSSCKDVEAIIWIKINEGETCQKSE